MDNEFERWFQVEQAKSKIAQLIALLNMFENEYIGISTEMFCLTAKRSHEAIGNIVILLGDMLIECRRLLDSAIEGEEEDDV